MRKRVTDQIPGRNGKTENLSISRYIYARTGVEGVTSLKIATGEQWRDSRPAEVVVGTFSKGTEVETLREGILKPGRFGLGSGD